MQDIDKYISNNRAFFLSNNFRQCNDYIKANLILKNISGINNFFDNQTTYLFFQKSLDKRTSKVRDSKRREYGDFQTPDELADTVCSFLLKSDFKPLSVIEPTFGKGSFIISALRHFKSIKNIFGIELYDKHVWETKFKILDFFLENPQENKPEIFLYKKDIFSFDFLSIKEKIFNSILVLGNPPWITNSELGSLNSNNLPNKTNLKNLKGLDAITGKGNFDIGESIALLMLEKFSIFDGKMALLIKNSVIKNIVQDLHKFNFSISNIETYKINAKKYFNASVESSLFTCNFNQDNYDLTCEAFETISSNSVSVIFGWYKNKFISDLKAYKYCFQYDGISPYEWRQGVKHDCSKLFELKKDGNYYLNGFQEKIDLEDDLLYGIIKSSDLKSDIISIPQKYVIITQRFIGEKTYYIKASYPKLFHYLDKHKELLNNRKSSIYKNKPQFSIFGIGEYSFKPYKIAISGLYKTPRFSLVFSNKGKCLMLDDTCYLLSFDDLEQALFTWCILNDKKVYNLLKTISFGDAKRPYTKEILMRIPIDKLALEKDFDEIFEQILNLKIDLSQDINYESWKRYLTLFEKSKATNMQASLF